MRPDDTVLRERSSQENFPVASRALPRAVRSHLLAIYGLARLIDDMGDELAGDRMGALDALEDQLQRAYRGTATHPAFVRLTPTLRALDLDDAPFRGPDRGQPGDQVVTRYDTFATFCGYCALSANPVGRLVLRRVRCRHAGPGRAGPTTSAAVSSCRAPAGRGRGLRPGPRLPPGRGPRPVRRAPTRIWRGRGDVGPLRAVVRHEVDRARGCSHRAASPALSQPPGPGAAGGRRIRGRWSRGP